MIKCLKAFKKFRGFKPETFSEKIQNVVSPCRGWFQLITLCIDEEPDFSNKKFILNDEIGLTLVLADIGAYRDKRIDKKAYLNLEKVIVYLKERKKDIILRVAYDHDGNGMEREPSFFRMVLEHAREIAQFVGQHYKDIFIYQGLLVGKWGEMHTTRFASEERLRELGAAFEAELRGKVFMAVRRPVQWRYMRIQPDLRQNISVNGLGLYNDGMFGSETDLGTYDFSFNKTKLWGKPWNRENEILFTEAVSAAAPCGGEALFGEGFSSKRKPEDYIEDLRKQGITYLNRYHDIKLIEYWEKGTYTGKGPWNGRSVLDYIGAHLGYRFVIREAKAMKHGSGCEIQVKIENTGFSCIYGDVKMYIEYEGKHGREKQEFSESLTACEKGTEKGA